MNSDQGSRARDPNRPWYAYARALFPSAPGRWIDLGCGQGEFIALTRSGLPAGAGGSAVSTDPRTTTTTPDAATTMTTTTTTTPIALDRSKANAAAAKAAGAAALAADLDHPLPFASQSLDGVAMIEVIEHIVQAERLVDELARVLRPGGWLIVTTPNVAHLTYRLRALTGHPPKQEGYHFRFFTQASLGRCLASRGFQVEASASFGKQAFLTKLFRLAGRGSRYKFRYRVPPRLESLLAQHFVWRLRRVETDAAG